MSQLDIVIPVYNEGEAILPVLRAIDAHVKTDSRILICFDQDTDTTLAALKNHSPKHPIVLIKNEGRGAHGAVMTGFHKSTAAAVLMIPADDDYNQPIVDSMVDKFKSGCEIVCASRFMKGGGMQGCPWLKAILVRVANFTLFHFAGLPTHDASNGFRLFSKRIVNTIEIQSKTGFTYSIEYVVKAHRMGYPICEIPAWWHERKTGESRFQLFKWLPGYVKWYLYAFQTRLKK
jgi:glycosyltransferase involved in cell wall biosynthesis